MNNINEIDVNILAEWIAQNKSFKLIDVRSIEEYTRGIIPGGEPLPLHLLPVKADDMCKETTHIFYCRTGVRSAQACSYMSVKGYKNVVNLRGGIMAWAQQSLPIHDPKQAVA